MFCRSILFYYIIKRQTRFQIYQTQRSYFFKEIDNNCIVPHNSLRDAQRLHIFPPHPQLEPQDPERTASLLLTPEHRAVEPSYLPQCASILTPDRSLIPKFVLNFQLFHFNQLSLQPEMFCIANFLLIFIYENMN